ACAARKTDPDYLPTRLGSWELLRLVGQGQLTSVYAARFADAGPTQIAAYALKILHPEWQDDARGLSMLAREVRVARAVSDPHVVPVLAAELEAPPYYLVMPLLDGCALAEHLEGGLQLDQPVAFWIARQVAEALAALHQAGWMHGDVKPANIF